jgi:hypothetical protein
MRAVVIVIVAVIVGMIVSVSVSVTMIVPAAVAPGLLLLLYTSLLIRPLVRVAGMVVRVSLAMSRMGGLGIGVAENRNGFWAHGCHWTAWSYYRVKHIGPGGCNENR